MEELVQTLIIIFLMGLTLALFRNIVKWISRGFD
jgi:hypothetical protein